MNIKINGKSENFEKNITVSELLILRNVKRAAVWVNGKQLLKSEYEKCLLGEGDMVKILRVSTGG